MNNIFNSVQVQAPPRSSFDLTEDRKLSLNMGRLVPIMTQEVLPGDSFNVMSQQFLRLAPMLAPIMHRVNVSTHFFFVPNRLVWNGWEDFITGGDGVTPSPAAPYVKIGGALPLNIGSVGDYMGLPTDTLPEELSVNALPIAGYIKVYNEYFRDENLQEAFPDDLEDGLQTDPTFDSVMRAAPFRRAWEKDYFTSALPFLQKGPAVTLPLGGEADIVFAPNGDPSTFKAALSGLPINTGGPATITTNVNGYGSFSTGGGQFAIDNSEQLKADLSTATATTINELRRATQLQKWFERNAIGGSRYIETIQAHFAVTSDDARLQRPEYLGGGISPVSISEVLQMSETETTPQGNMAGHGVNVGSSHQFKRFFKEHGFIIGVMSVMPKPAYFQGLPKYFSRLDKLDYYWSAFAHLGEQEVLNQEIYAAHTDPDKVFGYQSRYAEYKTGINTVHGEFRTNLDYWHMGRKFATAPALNEVFIECDPTDRIFAVEDPDTHKLYCYLTLHIKAKRPIPYYGTPTL